MPTKLDPQKIIANNPAINKDKFQESHKLLEERQKSGAKSAEYNILPPFTTQRRVRVLNETDDKTRSAHLRY